MKNDRQRNNISATKGFSLVEVIVGTMLFSIVSMGLAASVKSFVMTRSMALNKQLASQLAVEKLEEYSTADPATLVSGTSEEEVTRQGRKFARETTIIVIDGGGKRVTVSVQNTRSNLGGHVTLSNTLVPWNYS